MATDAAMEIARALLSAHDEGAALPANWLAAARAKVSSHALAEALLGIEAMPVEEYRSRAHALVMNWKGEAP